MRVPLFGRVNVSEATTWMRAAALCGVALVLAAVPGLPNAKADPPGSTAAPVTLPSPFVQIGVGPFGGTLWRGWIPDPAIPAAQRITIVYLPPNVSATGAYPVLYLLHGLAGSPYEFAHGLQLATVADDAIEAHRVPPFVAVAPPAGATWQFHGEWTGPWEDYVVDDVVPWVDANLPVLHVPQGRALAGLSAGGYGAVDIGLRHPDLFGTLESWSGYFDAPRDGSLAHADAVELAAHDPSLLVEREAPQLRRLGTRFYLSSATTHDPVTAADTIGFARELASLGLPYRLVLKPGGHDGAFWLAQMPAALRFALGPPSGT
jgi:enterochelin esterase-like enzyme